LAYFLSWCVISLGGLGKLYLDGTVYSLRW
jgi:hypothetical protein